MNLLNVRQLTQSYGLAPVYEDVSFGMDVNERVAVVGPNGCGKTTLFRILMGDVDADAGEIALRQGTKVSYLAQETRSSDEDTPRRVVGRAVGALRAAIKEHESVTARMTSVKNDAESLKRLLLDQDSLAQCIEELGGWDWERHVEEMVDRLGLTPWLDTDVARLSGGQRRRVDLARVLLEAPDLLLLDEPTNHLDPETVDWLEGWLTTRTKGLMLITHDRYFLERVVDRIIEVTREAFHDYPGNYRIFMERKLARMAVEHQTEERKRSLMTRELEHLKSSVKTQNRLGKQRLENLERAADDRTRGDDGEPVMEMELAQGEALGPLILSARGLVKEVGDRLLFDGTGIGLATGEKIGLIGPNGAGKTTLLRMLVGEERPDAGVVEVGEATTIGYLRQEGLRLDPRTSVYEAIGPSDYVWVGDTRHHKRAFLEHFLFDRDDQQTQVRLLSGGQKRRLQLARVVAENANVLILDEPTNDLDILSLQALESSLEDFKGCMIVVSHDRFFLNRVCNITVAVEGTKLVRYEGNYDAYRSVKERELQREREASAAQRATQRRQRHDEMRAERERERAVGLTYREELELASLEESIHAAETDLENVEGELANPSLYADDGGDVSEIRALEKRRQEIELRLEEFYDVWMRLEEKKRE